MTSPPQPDAVVTARALTGALNGLSGRLDAVNKDSRERDEELGRYGRRSRRMIIVTAVSLLADLLLTAGVTIVAIQAHSASSAAAATRAASVVSCQQSNQTRAQEVGLWAHLVMVSEAGPHPGQTAAQVAKSKEELAAFLGYVGKVFAPRACTQIYGAGAHASP